MCVVFVFCVVDFEACLDSKFESFAFVLLLLVGMVFADIGFALYIGSAGVLGVGGWDGLKETGILKVAGKAGSNLTWVEWRDWWLTNWVGAWWSWGSRWPQPSTIEQDCCCLFWN